LYSDEEFRDYLMSFDLHAFLDYMGIREREPLLREVEHFTEREAAERDQIVLSYFGRDGVRRIVETIVNLLLSPPPLKGDAKILDAGAGTGFFTQMVAKGLRLHLPKASIYAMDLTPAMLLKLVVKGADIIPFIGLLEDIPRSIDYARRMLPIPERFDAIFSTLTLHHCLHPEEAFESIRNSLMEGGRAVVVDLCEHPFEEFREEMGDIHLGFNPLEIRTMAEEFFDEVRVERLPGICCESSGRSAELFVALMRP
jgi:SAM-dependent methyltransferase